MQAIVPAVPYVWLLVFFLVPFGIVLKLSLSQTASAMPPYQPVLNLSEGLAGIATFLAGLNIDNFLLLMEDFFYGEAVLSSVRIAATATAILVVIGFPFAYAMAKAPAHRRPLLVLLVILPFWMSFLIRVYAWIGILRPQGLLDAVLMGAGLTSSPLGLLQTETAVLIGLVYCYLPFMILPLFATLEKFDWTLLEAAEDLGARPGRSFRKVTLPLALPGLAAGALLCFIPIMGEYVIPELLGGTDTLMIGKTLSDEFFKNRDWPLASAVAIVLLVIIIGPITLHRSMEMRRMEQAR
ncbi:MULTISPECIES: ABC transporter permease subunit [unclassified Chelatococcus]|uniref:ABC transporter permease subunit n=1 Tax=unclassified Chelatococcus TaxID=2638111 RepID=UPI001BD0B78E|nr:MULTISPECIES: ABC transporter permease subunit [unclassified Chelatococcus]MBS7738768.1 ABC transporter permease subunit [Chelatococcus sp. HY11]MBX3543172.1 ABC transporter permease subunit [Chelatococcus sp.]MCO5076702.1 ABC transporter permease subunit [Chelatococcus sp.]